MEEEQQKVEQAPKAPAVQKDRMKILFGGYAAFAVLLFLVAAIMHLAGAGKKNGKGS